MRLALKRHPDQPSSAVNDIAVEIAQPRADHLVLSYVVTGTVGDIRLPCVTTPVRSDELWRHTCFEAFIGAFEESAYYEFNFAPSTRWAAYRFTGYRNGMVVAPEIGAPEIDMQSSPDSCTLRATLALGCLSALPHDTPWRLGLSAVIEEMSGRLSYWALAHPPGPPDFHHADCFTYELPSAQSMFAKNTN
jgi:hypothetical protein